MRTRLATWTWLLAALLSSAGPLAARAEAPVTLVVVRHAEKEGGEDPRLTDAGRARAELLAHLLRDAKLEAILVSEWRRTQETAAPLARALAVTPRVVRGDVAADLRALAPGTRALVVSHSDVVPKVVAGLGCGEAPPLSDLEFDRLYVLTLEGDGRCTAIQLRYGAASVKAD